MLQLRFSLRLILTLIIFNRPVMGWTQTNGAPSLSKFHSPVSHPIRLSGTFGELRSTHFHQGIDIKSSRGIVGDKIFCVQDGIVSRIKVSAGGYGNALYIEHPNGLVSVYGHLHSFIPSIAELVHEEQYKRQKFEVDFNPTEDIIKVSGGQLIGLMGSTGHSFGPHLHLEIREKVSNKMLNPLMAFSIDDQLGPTLKRIKVHQLDHRFSVYDGEVFDPLESHLDTLEIDAWRIGIGVETFDPHNKGLNRNGIYGFDLYLNDTLYYGFNMDELSFEDAGFYPAHLDLETKRLDGHSFHTCYRKPANKASFYHGSSQTGIIPLFKDRLQKVKILVRDYSGNQRDWSAHIRRKNDVSPPDFPTFQYKLRYDKENTMHFGKLKVNIPEGSLLENSYVSLAFSQDNESLLPIYHVHRSEVPLLQRIGITMVIPSIKDSLKPKALIANISDGKLKMLASHWKQDTLIALSSEFGDFTMALDTVAPTIKLVKIQRLADQQILRFKLQDNYDYEGTAAKLNYTILVNDQWHLASYDLKSDHVECKLLRKNFKKGEHRLRMIVSDYVGNESTYDHRFNFN